MVVVTSGERRDGAGRRAWLPAGVIDVVAGGARRQESVAAGFVAFDRHGAGRDRRVVLVHDARAAAGRPPALVAAVAEATARHGAAIPVVPVAETLKRVDGDRVVGDGRAGRPRRRPDAAGRRGAACCARRGGGSRPTAPRP